MRADQCNIIRIEWDDLATRDQFCESREPRVEFSVASRILEAVSEVSLSQNP
jgi:hypothetical protein